MAYKDFTQYNIAAENIRPSARSQLVQRILNAATLISSLGQGVPLRWAQAYKGFQVLKYNSGSDPQDVTSAGAISAADSILHEAESQLRSSYDDMQTLSSEIEKMPVKGAIDWEDTGNVRTNQYLNFGVNVSVANIPNVASLKVLLYANPDFSNFEISIAGQDFNPPGGIQPPELASEDRRFGLPNGGNVYYSGFFVMKNPNSNVPPKLVEYFVVANRSNYGIVNIEIAINNSIHSYYANVSAATLLANITSPTSKYDVPLGSPTSGFVENGFMFDGNNLPLEGYIPAKQALGLPDPTSVINILDNM